MGNHRSVHLSCAVFLFATSVLAGCGNAVTGADAGIDASVLDGGRSRLGTPCTDNAQCRAGLQCALGVCNPLGNVPAGGACVLTADCNLPNYCGPAGTCVQPGTVEVDGACTSTGDCIRAAVCYMAQCSVTRGSVIAYFDGATRSGPPGTSQDLDGPCETLIDCTPGLACTAGRCTAPTPR